MFSHEKLKVYRIALVFIAEVPEIIRLIPPGNSELVSQLKRAAISITLNIAEGAGKTSENDKRRFFAIARGSALECAAALDICEAWRLMPTQKLHPVRLTLKHLVSLLSNISKRLEDPVEKHA